MASVTVHMNLCDKLHKITVTPNEEGTFDVRIATNCDHVKEYAKRLPVITMDDITDMSGSKVMSYETTFMMTPTCLAAKGVLYAAWLEVGMISPSRANAVKENTIHFAQKES